MSGGGERRRTMKIYCPLVSRVVAIVAWEEQRLDLGSIARTFGIDPPTLKLNGHFISRGVDLISSSVTWKSLLSFFSARGLSTGKDDDDPLIVHGKLCKPGTKRSHDPQNDENGIGYMTEHEEVGVNCGRQREVINNLKKKKKLTESNSDDSLRWNNFRGLGFKRKQWLEDVCPVKKLKKTETELGASSGDYRERVNDLSSSISKTQFPCNYATENTKRRGEDEVVVAAPCKKIR